MKNEMQPLGDESLRKLLREARPAPTLPPGFQNSVWRRIEGAELAGEPATEWLDRVVAWLLRPRLALSGLALLLVLGGSAGVMDGVAVSKRAVQERYVASVSPMTLRQ